MKFGPNISDHEKGVAVFTLILIVIMAMARIYENFSLGFSHDSAQHLHVSWLLSQGAIPYRDFFDNHPPLFWLPISILFRCSPFPAVQTFFYFAKTVTAGCFLLLLWVLFVLARKINGQTLAGLLTVLVFVASVPSRDVYFEVRPQILMFVFFLFGLYFFILFLRQDEKKIYLLLSSAMLVFSQMLLPIMPYIAGGLFLCMSVLVGRSKGMLYVLWYLVLPAIIVTLVSILLMTLVVDISDLYDYVILFNLKINPHAVTPKYRYFEPFAHLPLLLFGMLGIVAVLYKRLQLMYIIIGILLISAIELIYLFHSLWPQHYMTFYIVLALLAGPLVSSANQSKRLQSSLLLGAGLLCFYVFAAGSDLRGSGRISSRNYVADLDFMLANSAPSSKVFLSPSRHPIFRRDASFYWFGRWDLVRNIQENLDKFNFLPNKRELLDVRIPLLKNNPKYVMVPTSSWWSPIDANHLKQLPSSMYARNDNLAKVGIVEFDKNGFGLEKKNREGESL